MRNLKIFAKLTLSHSVLGLFIIITLSITFYIVLRNTLIQRSLDQLSSINILKKDLVESYFFRSQQNLEALQLEDKFSRIYSDRVRLSTTDQMSQDLADIENLCKLYNFKNLHVFDTQHRQLFSTDREMYPEGLLKEIDSAVSISPNRLRIIDATSYSPNKQVLLFYYVPILENADVVGIVLVQENFEKVEKILRETTGMGSSGESYIVGHDYTMRSSSRFFPDSLPSRISVRTDAVKSAFQQLPGQSILKDYRDVSVLSVYRNIENRDLQWVIVSEMDESEAMQPIIQLRNYFAVITLVILLLTIFTTYLLSNIIVRPVLALKEIIVTLSKGMIPEGRTLRNSTDEIGEMALAIRQLTQGLERKTLFAREIGSGNFDAPFTTLSGEDELGLSLIGMRDELRRFQEMEVRSARARAAALVEGQENERRRITKELHDGVGQMLMALRMQVDMLQSGNAWSEQIKSQIDETIAEVKRISYHVMPQAIVDFGLEAALNGLCDMVRKYSSATIDFRYIHETEHYLDFEISIAVFRIAQEGLNNMVKYAEASTVNLYVIDKADEVYFVLEDNGKGFSKDEMVNNLGSGLRNIQERATLLNGTAEIHSAPGIGTTIEVHIPIQ
ncbi:MAG: sensor histidine kinase [Cyclobacteriaceae bacterium]|nr:sensor histidine kinase [Cyclobacteriaceae bacterium]MDH4298012.1 sensor histidine kinase [Cyclobacteriaceae bacterium]MDH5251070.1 sensor histidine kinase [Cyclobacteriaceae bacterium]